HAPAHHLETDQATREPLSFHLEQRCLADEIPGVELDEDPETRLEWMGRFVDVVAVERQSRLQTQRVTRAQTAGQEAERCPRFHQLPPQRGRVRRRAEQLDAVFPGVAGARDRAADPAYRDVLEAEAPELAGEFGIAG